MKAAFFDVDGTLTETRVWNGLMDYFRVHRTRIGVDIAFQLIHYTIYFLHKLGLVSQVTFREVWAKDLSWYFKGYTTQQAAEIWDWVVKERISGQWRLSSLEKLKAHKEAGDVIFLVSGGPEGLLRRIADEIGADYVVGTRHVIEDGVYTGKAPEHACQGEKKVLLTHRVISENNLKIDFPASYAYADSLGDINLLEMVGRPVAVFPDEYLKPLALERGWEILEG